jgi:murein DD-endopeptidase MepM/ murein hydrolase activator NlpD
MSAVTGTPIRAALSGTVIKSYYNSSYGNYTVIDHGNGMTTGYAHQSQRLVRVGDTVEAGQVIGLVGSTGNSTGPHLHFEVRVNEELQDPKNYLP